MSLGLLAAMVSGPFLLPLHKEPLTSFWSEWWAAAAGLAAAATGLMPGRHGSLRLPGITAVPALLVVVLLLQFVAGRIAFPQIGLIYAMYLLWAGMLMILGRYLAETVGLKRLVDVLAVAVLLGALAGALVAMTQWLGISGIAGWMLPSVNGQAFGNLAQANHHSHYSWIGIGSAFYLRGCGRFSRPTLWAVILPLAFGAVVSGSRSTFLYPAILLAVGLWMRYRDPADPAAGLLPDLACLLPIVVALGAMSAWAEPFVIDARQSLAAMGWGFSERNMQHPSAGTRLLLETSWGTPSRLEIARAAWWAILDSPWLGHGPGNSAWSSFSAATGQTPDTTATVADHAHNIVLDAMLDFGVPTVAMTLAIVGIWIWRFAALPPTTAGFWCCSLLGVAAAHSLVEYPLWYAYFLGPVALLLGACDSSGSYTLDGRRAAAYFAIASIGGAISLANLRNDYAILEAVANRPLAAHPDRDKAWRLSMDRLASLQTGSLLSPWAMLSLAILVRPDRHLAADKAELCARAIRLSPGRAFVVTCAVQQALADKPLEARQLVTAALRAYPAQTDESVAQLRTGAAEFPEVLPLLNLAEDRPEAGRGQARPPDRAGP